MRGAEDELACGVVVEVDEARVGFERGCDLVGHEMQYLLEVEGGVDGGDRVREQPQVAVGRLHAPIVGGSGLGAVSFSAGAAVAGTLHLALNGVAADLSRGSSRTSQVTVCY